MTKPVVYFAGAPQEVAHHANPLEPFLNIKIASSEQVLSDAVAGDLVVFYSEHFDRFRNTCFELKQRRVATLYMIDGILEWRNAWENKPDEIACPYTMRPAIAHKVACIGNAQARVIEAWGNEGKAEVVGIPRLDAVAANWKTRVPRASASADDQPLRILVMTAKTPAFTSDQWERVREALRDLKHWADNHPVLNGRKLEWTWRLTKGLEQELGVQNQLNDLSGKELSEVLADVDLVVSTASTAMLEAMLFDRPVALLDYHNCPHYLQTGWDIASKEHITPTLDAMARRPESRMLFQRNQVLDGLYLESNATARLVELIQHMQRITAECVSMNMPLTFPPNLLTPPSLLSAEFSHQRLFPSVDAFRLNEQAELQAQLSHSRREIDRLHEEIEQLQSELEQAHQIFKSIEEHPIAGPIVRIRQKMLDLMAAIKKRKMHSPVNDHPRSTDNFNQTTPKQTTADTSLNTDNPIVHSNGSHAACENTTASESS